MVWPHDRYELQQLIHLNNQGQIVIDSRVKGWNNLFTFIEDNIVDSPNEQGEAIYWGNVWKEYDQWIAKNEED